MNTTKRFGGQQGQCDPEQRAARRGGIDGGSLVELLRDGLEAGEEDQGVKAHVEPDRYHDDEEARPADVEQEDLRGNADHLEEGVQQPVAIEEPFPDQADDDGRQQDRIEEHRPEEAARDDRPIEDQRRDQRHQQCGDDIEGHEPERIPHSRPEQRFLAGSRLQIIAAGKQRAEIVQADERALRHEKIGAAGEGVTDRDRDRKEREDGEQNEVRRQEQPWHTLAAEDALDHIYRGFDHSHRRFPCLGQQCTCLERRHIQRLPCPGRRAKARPLSGSNR